MATKQDGQHNVRSAIQRGEKAMSLYKKSAFIDYSHIHLLMNPRSLAEAIQRSVEAVELAKCNGRVDAIAVRGISGAAVGFAVAARVGLPVILVRKDGDDSHSGAGIVESQGHILVGDDAILRYVIIDDFIESGDTIIKTVRAIVEYAAMHSATCYDTECVGVILYSDWVLSTNMDGEFQRNYRNGESYKFSNGMKLPMYVTDPVKEPPQVIYEKEF